MACKSACPARRVPPGQWLGESGLESDAGIGAGPQRAGDRSGGEGAERTTMHRFLAAHAGGERRDQRRHPAYAALSCLAWRPKAAVRLGLAAEQGLIVIVRLAKLLGMRL